MVEKNKKSQKEIIHKERVDTDVATCPVCRSNKIDWVFTKRGVSIKCQDCGMDTHYWQDVTKHNKQAEKVAYLLKDLSPHLNFVQNIPIDSDVMVGKIGRQTVRYDFGVFWFADKIDKVKVSVVQNIDHKRYLTTDEQYLQGRQKVFSYLAKIDALMVFFLPNDPVEDKRLGIASCKELKRHAVEVKDRFGNQQYSIPKEIRPALIHFDRERIVELLHRNLWKYLMEKRYII